MKAPTILLGSLAAASAVDTTKEKRADTLTSWKFAPLPLGSVKPSGWLDAEAKTLANGLHGHLADFYDIVVDSDWFQPAQDSPGDYSNLMEALPYWFNGMVPLAYELDDDRLKANVTSTADRILALQSDDGWIGPETEASRNFWGRMPLFLGLCNLADADPAYTDKVVDALKKFFTLTNTMLKNNGQGFTTCANGYDCSWGQVRIADLWVSMQWLLEKHSSDSDDMIWETMNLFNSLNTLKWEDWYNDNYPHTVPNPDPGNPKQWPYIHGVDVAQGLKYFAVLSRFNGDSSYIDKAKTAVDWTFQYYGTAAGAPVGDEAEKDLAPYHGSELCTVAETIYSLSYLYQITGDKEYADKAERAAFNAYPVMMTGDKFGHQYISQQNQISATEFNESSPYVNAGSPFSSVFGLEPNYKCCTMNHGQGYPKFIANSWVSADNGLTHALLGPSTVSTTVNDGTTTISVDTNYPFTNVLTYNVDSDKAFDLYIRVPGWYVDKTSSIKVGSGDAGSLSPDDTTGLHKVSLPAGKSTITYTLGAEIRSEQRPNNAVAVYYGALHYALDIGSDSWTTLPHEVNNGYIEMNWLPSYVKDYFYSRTKEWNVAIDTSTWKYTGMKDGDTMPDPLYDPYAPPTSITIQGCTIDWGMYNTEFVDWAPTNPVCTGDQKEYTLLPLGGAKLHMSDLPVVKF